MQQPLTDDETALLEAFRRITNPTTRGHALEAVRSFAAWSGRSLADLLADVETDGQRAAT